MKTVTTATGSVLGPFNSVAEVNGVLVCDGAHMGLDIIGAYTLDDYVPHERTYTPEELAPLKAAKNEQINEWRGKANEVFTFAAKQIAVDALSMKDINMTTDTVLLTGAFPPNWPGGWKTIDNSYVAIPDVATWKAFIAAACSRGSDNFAHAQMLKGLLAAATTPMSIDMIAW